LPYITLVKSSYHVDNQSDLPSCSPLPSFLELSIKLVVSTLPFVPKIRRHSLSCPVILLLFLCFHLTTDVILSPPTHSVPIQGQSHSEEKSMLSPSNSYGHKKPPWMSRQSSWSLTPCLFRLCIDKTSTHLTLLSLLHFQVPLGVYFKPTIIQALIFMTSPLHYRLLIVPVFFLTKPISGKCPNSC
jgi:hypothetical protein